MFETTWVVQQFLDDLQAPMILEDSLLTEHSTDRNYRLGVARDYLDVMKNVGVFLKSSILIQSHEFMGIIQKQNVKSSWKWSQEKTFAFTVETSTSKTAKKSQASLIFFFSFAKVLHTLFMICKIKL